MLSVKCGVLRLPRDWSWFRLWGVSSNWLKPVEISGSHTLCTTPFICNNCTCFTCLLFVLLLMLWFGSKRIICFLFANISLALHELLSDNLSTGLADHSSNTCIVCTPEALSEDEVGYADNVSQLDEGRCK